MLLSNYYTRPSMNVVAQYRRLLSTSARPPLLGRYTDTLPVELFRVQSGLSVKLREKASQLAKGRTSFDLQVHQEDGLVHPKPGPLFEGPNGMSLRPNGPMFQEVLRNFRGRNIVVFRIPKDTPIPNELILLHEHSDHYSMQCRNATKLRDLNRNLEVFLVTYAERLTKSEFFEKFPDFVTG